MAFTGPYPTVFSGQTAAMVIGHTTFSGGVTNIGTIGPGGISVSSSTFLSGGIVDTGTIAGGIAIDNHSKILDSGGVAVFVGNTTTFGGGVRNVGLISAFSGVVVSNVAVFGNASSGGVTNSGVISSGSNAIHVVGGSTFFGGLVNSGTISGHGTDIYIQGTGTFLGGVINAGLIASPLGNTGIKVFGVSSFGNGISNTGKILASALGIDVTDVAIFSGGITNGKGGTISGAAGWERARPSLSMCLAVSSTAAASFWRPAPAPSSIWKRRCRAAR